MLGLLRGRALAESFRRHDSSEDGLAKEKNV